MTTKVCSKCKVEKDLEEFYRDGRAWDGLGSYCKQCNNARKDEWRANNPEKEKARKATWNANNPEKVKAHGAAWRAANPEKVKAKNAAWHAANSEKAKVKSVAWRAANPEKVKAKNAAWYEANPEKAKENGRTYRAEITDTLADPYIKHLLGTDNPSQELIEHKREHLLMYRATRDLLKTLKDEDNE